VLGLALAFLLASLFPRVENPWPETIGLSLPFALAGAGAILGGVLSFDAPPPRRDRQIRWFGLVGFCFGMAFYFISLVVEVGFR
jgi:hypothetical protein